MVDMSRCLKLYQRCSVSSLLEGNWDITEGAAFTEFDVMKHVITPFEIPVGWERLKGIDYGYASESLLVFGALLIPQMVHLIIYRELIS
jgi:hypothetical protein